MPKLSTSNIVILMTNQQGKCYYCGVNLYTLAMNNKTLHIDHKIPHSKGGASKIDNYCLTCAPCNHSKNNKSVEEFKDYLKPYLDGYVFRKDLLKFREYLKLHNQFGHIVNSQKEFDASTPTTIAEYCEIINRIGELEAALQGILDRLEENNIPPKRMQSIN